MVEMCVRYVRRHVPSNSDVAVLGPSTMEDRPLIALTLSRPEALELAEELADRQTARGKVYDVLVNVLGAAGVSVASINVLAAPGQSASACVQLDGPHGLTEIQVEVGQAIGLAVRTGQPIQVSDRLVEAVTPPSATKPAEPATDTEPEQTTAVDVPDQFRRAFDRPGAPRDED